MQNLKLEFIWKRPRAQHTHIKFHTHNFYELVYYVHGNGITTINETSHHFNSGTFVLITPNTPHSEQHYSDTEVICLGFTCEHTLSETLHTDDSGIIFKIMQTILSETSLQEPNYIDMIQLNLNELYILLQRMQHPETAIPKNFEYIIHYMNENYHEKIRLTALSRQIHISYDYFQHKFKQLTGLSPQQYLLNRRLVAAKNLLLHFNLSCTEIAYQCGFSTPAQFSMLFKKTYGISPLAFKKGM